MEGSGEVERAKVQIDLRTSELIARLDVVLVSDSSCPIVPNSHGH